MRARDGNLSTGVRGMDVRLAISQAPGGGKTDLRRPLRGYDSRRNDQEQCDTWIKKHRNAADIVQMGTNCGEVVVLCFLRVGAPPNFPFPRCLGMLN